LCTCYGAEEVAGYCGDGSRWSIRVRYSVEGAPLGTAGAIKHAESLIESDPFIVMNGDSMVQVDLTALLEFHKNKNAEMTMVLTRVEDKARFGSVRLAEDGSIVGFSEKGRHGPGLISAGIYSMSRSILEVVPEGRTVSLEFDVLPYLTSRQTFGMPVMGTFVDIGTPEAYQEAQQVMSARQAGAREWQE